MKMIFHMFPDPNKQKLKQLQRPIQSPIQKTGYEHIQILNSPYMNMFERIKATGPCGSCPGR